MTKDELCRLEQPELVRLIEEGRLVYLPCKVGDKVYIIGKLTGEIFELTVEGFSFVKGKLTVITDNGMLLTKYYFFSREQAEQNLKEMELR